MTTQEFIKANELTFRAVEVFTNPNMDPEWSKTARHWQCRISKGSHSMYVPFSQGSAHKKAPKLAEVLYCLALDASGVQSFEDWASEFGYDTDSRKAERTFNTILEQTSALRGLLGLEAFNTLLNDVERL